MSPAPPQVLNQAPPGAQQLTTPDLANAPHFGHAIALSEAMAGGLADVVIGVRTTSSRLRVVQRRYLYLTGHRRLVGFGMLVGFGLRTGARIVGIIDPCEPLNMSFWVAFEWTQAAPDRCDSKLVASLNM